MNDIVLTIQKRKIYTNKENKVTKFELSIDLSAAGATKSIGAAIMLDNVPAMPLHSQLNSVTILLPRISI